VAAKGQVRKRGRSWQVDVSVNGERVRRSVGASTPEARRILEQLHEMPGRAAALGHILGGYLGSLRLRGKSRTIHQGVCTRHASKPSTVPPLTQRLSPRRTSTAS